MDIERGAPKLSPSVRPHQWQEASDNSLELELRVDTCPWPLCPGPGRSGLPSALCSDDTPTSEEAFLPHWVRTKHQVLSYM